MRRPISPRRKEVASGQIKRRVIQSTAHRYWGNSLPFSRLMTTCVSVVGSMLDNWVEAVNNYKYSSTCVIHFRSETLVSIKWNAFRKSVPAGASPVHFKYRYGHNKSNSLCCVVLDLWPSNSITINVLHILTLKPPQDIMSDCIYSQCYECAYTPLSTFRLFRNSGEDS